MNKPKKLTPKQEAWALAFMETGNGAEAYRRSYDAENMSDDAINVEVQRLQKHPLVALRLQGLRQKAETKAILSLEEHMNELKTLREMAKESAQMSAAIKAEELRGKLRRFYVEQVEHGDAHDFSRMSDEELDAFLADDPVDGTPAEAPAKRKSNGKSNGHAKH